MKELSLNILDISQNSLKAKASIVYITLLEEGELLKLTIEDDGCGMTDEILKNVTDPFCTTRTTRKVGLGIPFLKQAAEQTGGRFEISSKHQDIYPDEHGTRTYAEFYKNHLDFTPLGDMVSTMCILIQGAGDTEIVYSHKSEKFDVNLDTRELRAILGEDVKLSELEVLDWINSYLVEQYNT